jgi:hypothetical protein
MNRFYLNYGPRIYRSFSEPPMKTMNKGFTVYNSVALSAQYTDRAAATGRRIFVPTFADRGLSRGRYHGS